MLSFDSGLVSFLKNTNSVSFWVLKLYYNDDTTATNFIGVSDQDRVDGSDFYDGIVSSWGNLNQSLDFFNFSTSTGNLSVKLINTESSIQGGRFSDLFSSNNFANRKWELFQNTNGLSTFDTAARMIGTGIISGNIAYDTKFVNFKLLDYSSKYHKQLPTNVVASATYANAPEKNVDKPIPIAYGDFYEKTDIGTIPTGNFDRFKTFYKSAFPAIITDKFDVGAAAVEAHVDSQAINTLDDENVYYYKNGNYATITGTVDATTNNPRIELSGSRCKVYFPLSSSGFATGASSSGSHTNEANISNGTFDTSNLTTIACDSGDNVTVTFALPTISKMGEYVGITALTKFKAVTVGGSAGSLSSLNTFLVGNVAYGTGNVTTDAELSNSIASVFSGDTNSWNFEGTLVYKLLAGQDNGDLSVQVLESGVVVEFDIDTIESHKIQELYEEIVETGVVRIQTQFETERDVFSETIIKTRTKTTSVPSEIDYVYCSGKGRQYGAYIDADSRNQGYNKDALIENPIFIIENILRSELGTIYTGSATSTTSNKLVDSGASFATSIVGQTIYNITDKTSAMVTARDSGTTLSIDANIMASGESYIIGGLTSSEIDYASFDTSGNTSDGYLGDIYDDSIGDIKFAFSQYKFISSKDLINRLSRQILSWVFIGGDGKFKVKTLRRTDDYDAADKTIDYYDINLKSISKTPLGGVRNDIIINYNYDYGQDQFLSSVNDTDSTSQGTSSSGNNQTLKLEIDADTLDSDTATQLADAYKETLKGQKVVINFNCLIPKYNDLEIGDIILFSNWDSKIKIYGTAMGTDYYMVSSISKTPFGCSIKAIKVS